MQQQGQKTELNFGDVPKPRGQDAPGIPPLGDQGGAVQGDLDVQGALRCDSLRIDAAPATAAAVASTHKIAVNLNGTTYYLLLSNV